MPTEHDYIDVRDLFASINPSGLDEKDLARDGASFVEPHTINDYHLFRAGYQAALEAQQDQGDLVGQVVAFGHGLHEVSWEKGRMPVLGTKLYTHGAPPEAERLRRALKGAMTLMTEGAARERDSIAELDILRAQLAEAQALLREWRHGKGMTLKQCAELNQRTDAALSASAEPSAPAEIDERAEFEQACREAAIARGQELDPEALRRRADGSHVNPLTECGWWGWRVRAALDHKP